MSATTITIQRGAQPNGVPWGRLAWVTWRQHRVALAGAAGLLTVIAVYLLIMGQKIHDAYNAYIACLPAGSAACTQLGQAFNSYYGSQSGSVLTSGINPQSLGFLLLALPVLLGTFLGAPVLARELESGTFRFAWTQGAGRIRWTVARLVPLAVVLAAAAAGISLLFSWYTSPFVESGMTGKFPMQMFGTTGVAFAAWTLFSFALAAFLGTVIRRTVVAMAATLSAVTVLDMVTMMFLRQRYEAPVTSSGTIPSTSRNWLLANWFQTASGRTISPGTVFDMAGQARGGPPATPAAFQAWLAQQHITQWFSYQPGSRWWTFQLIEGGWLLAASLVLIVATIAVVARRPS